MSTVRVIREKCTATFSFSLSGSLLEKLQITTCHSTWEICESSRINARKDEPACLRLSGEVTS